MQTEGNIKRTLPVPGGLSHSRYFASLAAWIDQRNIYLGTIEICIRSPLCALNPNLQNTNLFLVSISSPVRSSSIFLRCASSPQLLLVRRPLRRILRSLQCLVLDPTLRQQHALSRTQRPATPTLSNFLPPISPLTSSREAFPILQRSKSCRRLPTPHRATSA